MRNGKAALAKLDAILGRHRPRTELQHDNINGYTSATQPCAAQPGPAPGSENEINSLASGPLELQTPEQMLEGMEGQLSGSDQERKLMEEEIARTMGGMGVEKVVFADDNTRLTVDENGQTHREGSFEIDCRGHRGGCQVPQTPYIPDNIHEYNRGAPGGS